MRHCLLTLVLAAAALVTVGCEPIKTTEKPQMDTETATSPEIVASDKPVPDDEPLPLDDEPLLLLDDGPETDVSAEPGADNSRCFVCHINYMQEDIAVIHARADIGCKDCHGDSDAHIADESWASGGNGTPPDTMYLRTKVNPACMTCHPKDKIDAEQHKPLFASTAEKMVCTDCHGNHRLARRRCKWK